VLIHLLYRKIITEYKLDVWQSKGVLNKFSLSFFLILIFVQVWIEVFKIRFVESQDNFDHEMYLYRCDCKLIHLKAPSCL